LGAAEELEVEGTLLGPALQDGSLHARMLAGQGQTGKVGFTERLQTSGEPSFSHREPLGPEHTIGHQFQSIFHGSTSTIKFLPKCEKRPSFINRGKKKGLIQPFHPLYELLNPGKKTALLTFVWALSSPDRGQDRV
jgi:hypothetical protein